MILLFVGFSVKNLLNLCLNERQSMLLESENLYMKLKIQKLEFELESEKIRSRHFEGLSQIALCEIKKAQWINAIDRSSRLEKLIQEFQMELRKFESVKGEMISQVCKLENIVCAVNAILK
jgi:hypothetical protein